MIVRGDLYLVLAKSHFLQLLSAIPLSAGKNLFRDEFLSASKPVNSCSICTLIVLWCDRMHVTLWTEIYA